MSVRSLFFATLLIAGVAVHGAPAQAASAIQSTNCPNATCAQFGSTAIIPTIKSYRFSMPRAGTALITFNGSLFCGAGGGTSDQIIDLVSAISSSETAPISLANTSALRLTHVLKDGADHAIAPSTSFNLQSTKLLTYSSGGMKTVYFRISRARQDQRVTCVVNGGSFTIVRTP